MHDLFKDVIVKPHPVRIRSAQPEGINNTSERLLVINRAEHNFKNTIPGYIFLLNDENKAMEPFGG